MTFEAETDRLIALRDAPTPPGEPVAITERHLYRIDSRREDIKLAKRYGEVPGDLCHVCEGMRTAANTPYFNRVTQAENLKNK